MKLPDIDGEWELWNGDGVSDEWDRSNFRILKRIPPKEKSLYERCIQAERDDGYTTKALADEKATAVICQHIEQLEKRVERMETSCVCNACKLERFK